MKSLLFVMVLIFGAVHAFGELVSVKVKVIDDLGAPVEGADVLVLFQDYTGYRRGQDIDGVGHRRDGVRPWIDATGSRRDGVRPWGLGLTQGVEPVN